MRMDKLNSKIDPIFNNDIPAITYDAVHITEKNKTVLVYVVKFLH